MKWVARTTWATALVLGALAISVVVAAAAPVPVKPGKAVATQFPQSLQCVCHGLLLGEWQESMHSKALDDPLFKVKVDQADRATGGKLGPFCRRCHGPVANMTSQDGLGSMSPAAAQGVVCSFCHQVRGMSRPVANVPHLLVLTGVMRAHLKDAQAPHFTAYSSLHASSKICGGCHNVDHPVNGMHLETTYTEWQKSPQAGKGIQCQDCHMSESPPQVGPSTGFAAEEAPQRNNIYHMTFAGAQVALGNAARATALLKSAAKVEIRPPDVVPADSSAEVTVVVTNVGAGHDVPTGVTDIRQVWLSVVAVDGDGKETEIGRRVFGTEFKDSKGNHPVEIQDATGVAKDDRLRPMKPVTQPVTLAMPPGIEMVEVKARLLYKSAPDELAKRAGVENPTTTMAEAAARVFATEAAKAADASPSISTEASGTGGGAQGGSSPTGPLLICGGILALLVALGVWFFLRLRKSEGR
jgi:hypothetical protein